MKTEQIESLYKECPAAMTAVEDYLDNHMKSTPEAIKEMDALKEQFGTDKKTATRIFMVMGERFLYEFFDEKNIYISIGVYYPLGEGSGLVFVPDVLGDYHKEGKTFPTRAEAEAAGFEIAFRLLEEKLG